MDRPFHAIRNQYTRGVLDERQVDPDPLVQLGSWVSDAVASDAPEPTAMVLSTSGTDLKPSSRVVLMKGLDEQGVTFFTNYDSRKGEQLAENPNASLLFFWPTLERQVRIEGIISRVSEAESDAYFVTRPEASRISAVISPQSREIPDRHWLEESWQVAVNSRLAADPTYHGLFFGIRPSNWGGYRLIPDYFEFWQGRADRLHDRIIYRPYDPGWKISRLAP